MSDSKRRHTVALDLDGVLAEYHGWQGIYHIGEPLPGAVEFCNKLAEKYDVVIHTARCNTRNEGRPDGCTPQYLRDIVVKWLEKHGFKYHDVYTGQGKVIASAYVDDRAVSCRPQDCMPGMSTQTEYNLALGEVDYLCNYTSTKEKDKSWPPSSTSGETSSTGTPSQPSSSSVSSQ